MPASIDTGPRAAAESPFKRVPWFAIALIVFIAVQWLVTRNGVDVLPYSEFLRELKDGNVAQVRVYSDRIEGTLNRPRADGRTLGGFSRSWATRSLAGALPPTVTSTPVSVPSAANTATPAGTDRRQPPRPIACTTRGTIPVRRTKPRDHEKRL